MAALLGQARPDPAGEADERRVAGSDVTHAQLGHRQVEHRIPVGPAEADGRDDQRQPDEGEQAGHDHGGAGHRPGRDGALGGARSPVRARVGRGRDARGDDARQEPRHGGRV